MAPTDKNKLSENSSSGEGQSLNSSKSYATDPAFESASSSSSNVTIPGHSMTTNIPLTTANQPTLKCSINDQMKTFDPGEEGGVERLASGHCGNPMLPGKYSSNSNSCCLTKASPKNYKAGSKINKLADMLAKRSQNVVEVTQNNSPDIVPDISSAPKVDDAVILNNVCNIINFVHKNSESSRARSFLKTASGEKLDVFKKSRRKSVPNQSCNLQRLQVQSTSKSCSDFSKLFTLEENSKLEINALGGSPLKLLTDECTKKKTSRKTLKNVELPHILPERKRRSSTRNENLVCKKIIEKVLYISNKEPSKEGSEEMNISSIPSTIRSADSTKQKKEGRVRMKKSKRLVETSTQTADIEFISVLKPNLESSDEKPAENEKIPMIYECLYCSHIFSLGSECRAHEKTHLINSKQLIKCQYCSKKLSSLDELKSHCIQKHPNKYAYCIKCDERFITKEELYIHNKDVHLNKSEDVVVQIREEENEKKKEETEEKLADKKTSKPNASKADLKIDVSFDSPKKSSVSPRNVQKGSPKESKTEEQLLEMEMLFYSHLSGNIQENLANHLDGKIDKSGNPVRTDQISESAENTPSKSKNNVLLTVITPNAVIPDTQVSRAPSPYQTRSKTPNPLPPTAKKFKKLPNWQQKFWEKYNFPTSYRYEHKFWDKNYFNTEKSAFYLKDLSCLDIKTQLTMRENIKKLDSIKENEENSKPLDKLKFPNYLSLVPKTSYAVNQEQEDMKKLLDGSKNKKQVRKEETRKSFKCPGSELPIIKSRRKLSSDNSVGSKKLPESGNTEGIKIMTRRQSSLDLMKEDKEEENRREKGILDNSCNQRMTLRRQKSLNNLKENLSQIEKNNQILELSLSKLSSDSSILSFPESAEISGEWVRPRSYLCGTCCSKFTNLWELEDHKWVSHPNVWCTHYEFEDEKIDKLFQNHEDDVAEANKSDTTSKLKLTDLYKRYLLPYGSLKTAKLVPSTNFPEQCTKCKKNCTNSSELHKHILDCGGDTTWFLTMYSSPLTIKRKWRPFGSRRRKQIGRRDFKRNIPTTPSLRSYQYQHRIRTKPGDVESIQKMLANLPEKRVRRAINFDEIKTRSQATIHSNRLLRKRFKSTFTSNFLKLKNLKQKRPLKPVKKEGGSKSATDISSESTPVGSPNRKIKLKEGAKLFKEEIARENTNENLKNTENKLRKKNGQNCNAENVNSPKSSTEIVKIHKAKVTNEKPKKKEKLCSRSDVTTVNNRPKRKGSLLKEEAGAEELDLNVQNKLKTIKEVPKTKKKLKKQNKKPCETVPKKEVDDTVKTILKVDEDVVENCKNVKDLCPVESLSKKSHLVKAQTNSNLRLKQIQNKTEILKKVKKKIKKSKQVLYLKQAKKLEGGSRRSQRIKALRPFANIFELTDTKINEDVKKEDVAPSREFKFKKTVVSLENIVAKKPLIKTPNKSPKSISKNIEKEAKSSEENLVRKSPRSFKNLTSSEEKSEILNNEESSPSVDDSRKISAALGNSKSLSESILPSFSDVQDEFFISKKPLISIRDLKAMGDAPKPVLANGRIPMEKDCLSNSNIFSEISGLEETPDADISFSSKYSDLEEMPVLAKVEPIRGKVSGKSEKEIPVLLPVVKDEREALESEKPTKNENVVSFKVIKKRKKTPKEVTPLKIVKEIESVSFENENGFKIQKKKNVQEKSEPLKVKRQKFDTAPVVPEKRTKNDNKKYFLEISPIEIDKGRQDQPDETGSDSEPLISLVLNQAQNEKNDGKNSDNIKNRFERYQKPSKSGFVKKYKKKKGSEKKMVAEPYISPESLLLSEKVEQMQETVDKIQGKNLIFSKTKEMPEIRKIRKQKKLTKKKIKRLRMTVTLKEPTLKIVEKPFCVQKENKWTIKLPEEKIETRSQKIDSVCPFEKDLLETEKESVLPERRSRRISKENKSSNEFRIDDPLILVDELWSDLDSDSDSSKKRTKKAKKRTLKRKGNDEQKVNLEELLKNFGENKDADSKIIVRPVSVKLFNRREKVFEAFKRVRKAAENFQTQKSYRRLSLNLFRFIKIRKNFGNKGERLADAIKASRERQDEILAKSNRLPDLPFLAAEIKENPVQVIQCRAQKSKVAKRLPKKLGSHDDIHLKISLPLESINNMTVFNNNHLTELVLEEPIKNREVTKEVSTCEESLPKETEKSQEEAFTLADTSEGSELKNKLKRSDVIDKIFSCEICKTYYYSSSQLKIHKLSNRHKAKESKYFLDQQKPEVSEDKEPETPQNDVVEENVPPVEKVVCENSKVNEVEAEKINEDTLEMPTLEGPFIENPLTRLVNEPVEPAPQPPIVSSFGFSQESLKDIQQAIGCTDEEMLILTLLGENTAEIEKDILNLDTCESVQLEAAGHETKKVEGLTKETEKANGALKIDLKQRMTSALACLVNKAVCNLLQKYETAAKTAVNPEALSLLGKLQPCLSKQKNILQLSELLKKQNDGETSIGFQIKGLEKKEPIVTYKYQCTICGSRFEKASTRECHINRSHKGKAKKQAEVTPVVYTPTEDDWNDSWSYDANDDHLGNSNSSQFWCSDCGINFLSPQEVFEHQKLEHQAGLKKAEQTKDTGPLQSSTIGSSDEIIEGKKPRKRPKFFSSEELDQQRIIANNELRKLDRKFSTKNKANKIKWGMDALRFTVEKETKVVVQEDKEAMREDSEKTQIEVKSIDLVPKLNLSRTSTIPEFKVIQKNSFKSRFQKIIDNKLKRKSSVLLQQESEPNDVETEVMLVPVVVKKKNKKQKGHKNPLKKEEEEVDKPLDIYDFNESESEGEPITFSHVKKPAPSPPKFKVVKIKEGPSKNKADSTTKDLAPDDYDSEDSLPLSLVKKVKVGDEDDEKEVKILEEDKSEGILEQVEYLIEQLENEAGSSLKKSNENNDCKKNDFELKNNFETDYSKEQVSKNDTDVSPQSSLRVSVANKFLELDNIPLKHLKGFKDNEESLRETSESERAIEPEDPDGCVLVVPESSQSTFDEEDSIPLVLMSKKAEKPKDHPEVKKCDENTTDVSTTGSEDLQLFKAEDNKSSFDSYPSKTVRMVAGENTPSEFSPRHNDGFSEKVDKPFETVNGNVIYCRNDSLSDFCSDFSNDGLIHSNFEKNSMEGSEKDFIKEVTEKEDVVIVCSKRNENESDEGSAGRKPLKPTQRERATKERKETVEYTRKKKKRFPLLTATIEKNNFRNSESPKLSKEVIVRRIWNRRKLTENSTDNDDDSFTFLEHESLVDSLQNDESQTAIEKEVIVKKIWSRKKTELDDEFSAGDKVQDVRINQTEVSDEVVIKCGPKMKSPKRRKSKSSNSESSKETIMRKIWSGKCTFQTKAALKTYDSDMILNCKENELSEERKPKKRGRPPGMASSNKQSKLGNDIDNDEDDLDSLLEEIEREQLEKAIRLEFLQLRRSEKANVDTKRDGGNSTVGLFAETCMKHQKEVTEKKRRKVRRKIKLPRQSVIQRRKYIKKPVRRVIPIEERLYNEKISYGNSDLRNDLADVSLDKNNEVFEKNESKIKNRKHKKHRHKHHHHKHKHKKSKHRKCIISKHKSKHSKFEGEERQVEDADSFTILKKICQEIPNQIENEVQLEAKNTKKKPILDYNGLSSEPNDGNILLFDFENKSKDCSEAGYDDDISEKKRFESDKRSMYDFVDDVPDFTLDGLKKCHNARY